MDLPVRRFAGAHERVRICANRMARCSTCATAHGQDTAATNAGKSRRKTAFSVRRSPAVRSQGAWLHGPCSWLPPGMGTAVRGVRFRLAIAAALILSLAREASSEPLNWADLLATQTPEPTADPPPVPLAPPTLTPRRAEHSGVTPMSTMPPRSQTPVTRARRRGTADARTPFKPSLQGEFPHVGGIE